MGKILQKLKKQVLVYDGALGTMLQGAGLQPGKCPEEWNLSKPNELIRIHKLYVDSGSDVITTNSFGSNRLSLKQHGLGKKCYKINYQAVKLAQKAIKGKGYVAASVGPLPKMVAPLGKLSFQETFDIFKEQIKALSDAKPDIIILETFSDIKELKIAVMAAQEVCNLPIQAQLTFVDTKTTISGTTPEVAVAVLEGLGVDVVGVNCSLGPKGLYEIMKRFAKAACSQTYLSVLPNAGLPEIIDGETCYKALPKELASYSKKFLKLGVNILGGCCGTTPDHIKAIAKAVKGKKAAVRKAKKKYLTLSSRTHVLEMSPKSSLYVIGERINPTRRKVLQEEFRSGKTNLVRDEAILQIEKGAHLLDVNVGMPGINEPEMMKKIVAALQQSVAVPLVLDSNRLETLEAGLQEYVGKPMVNSVNGEKEKMRQLLPLVKKYGGSFIALTIDDKGIPKTADARIKVAKKIQKEALKIGIRKEDIIFDLLTLAEGAQKGSAKITLNALSKAKKLGWQTSLGVSNISFGLPNRSEVNNAFLGMAMKKGLTAAIINPADVKISKRVGKTNELLSRASGIVDIPVLYSKKEEQQLYESILKGNKENIVDYLKKCLFSGKDALQINQEILIPALEKVGELYDKKKYFLPQLLLAAEAMQKAVAVLQKHLPKGYKKGQQKILMATVKGDLHDIGKNIVASVLQNYGYDVIDLGKDVSVKKIVDTAKKEKVAVVGLSSLMTTTMGQMELVIKELKRRSLKIPTIVGGAVVSESYAKKINAAAYAKDAICAVNAVKRVLGK